ncbi:bifunctional phosphoribosyl-AMP cyclohydrolase/phosphoribosyl-ATP diphosphatase HisIE [Marinigracilibium pacificum]|uniref:Histidine biosynthesis bifunctional protein HisIE n=1 Tax=Marinigracilibium pacificum TaxID=2729599 RepID=A0A848J884_9BACT|nr:bifunctional phosphoribosyl-AMP cyclohydrolase/phosphoribosyl-ATP diphosphatase HisIE [Marinigracilibium pacificum]NMM50634.1 bifunctional phosphoribosyl-AMP cyclohydrolase/phosphoribosyl-ATP diphosphatase HisIE [Marinigracilibium pacificum]
MDNNLNIDTLDFAKGDGLIPAIIQDVSTKNVLMMGYMNRESLEKTLETGLVTFYSRSKQRLWTKGETSGNVLKLVSIKQDCDADTLLVYAKPSGPTCHTGSDTCFDESNKGNVAFIDYLKKVIKDRYESPTDESYTSSLFKKGINKVAQKVGEEAVEIVIEAKDDNKDLFLGEAADLLYHYLVLLQAKEIDLEEVIEVLQKRHK